MKVLVVEDDAQLRKDVSEALSQAGFSTDEAADGETAWFMGDTENYDGIVLDLGLPVKDGLSVLKLWRKAGVSVPVIILSARGTWMERVEGIDAGADDYMAKPFEMIELIARLRALIRRSAGQADPVLQIGDVQIDTRLMRVSVKGKMVELSALEYRLVHFLSLHHDRIVSPTELSEHIYGDVDARDPNALEALIGRIRRKIGAGTIETRRGFGYRFAGDV
ncbi:response regulator transcription factor [Bartonella sp. LJL80]